jgi:hypothetical protein
MISKYDSVFAFKTQRILSVSYKVKFRGYSLFFCIAYQIYRECVYNSKTVPLTIVIQLK